MALNFGTTFLGGVTDSDNKEFVIEDLFVNGDMTVGNPEFDAPRAIGWFYDQDRDIQVKIETEKVGGLAQLELYNNADFYGVGIVDADGKFFIHSDSENADMIWIIGSNVFLNIPAADPSIAGALWNNSGVVNISSG